MAGRRASQVAALQQLTVGTLLLAALAFAAWAHPRWGPAALVGSAAILLLSAWVLALEFGLLALVGRADPAPRPGALMLVRAWWHESLAFHRVFGWRQPFRWWCEPDHVPGDAAGRTGVVFVHGFGCNRGFWAPWMRRLRGQGRPFIALNLEPAFGSIDDYAPQIEQAVQAMQAATGRAPVLICHSMGGLAARAWLRTRGEGACGVAGIATLGTPHQGTWLARFSGMTNGRQMRQASPWLTALACRAVERHHPLFLCWYSNCDNIVFPPSTATLPGADNRLMPGVGHVELAFVPRVIDETLAFADR